MGFSGLTVDQMSTLSDFSANDKELPGAYARNLLAANAVISYDEPILVPTTPLKSKRIIHLGQPKLSQTPYYLKVYPNPANTYFIIEYKIPKNEILIRNCTIDMYDILGHQMMRFPLEKIYDRFKVNCEKIQPGIYIVSLKSNGKTKGQAKVLIQK